MSSESNHSPLQIFGRANLFRSICAKLNAVAEVSIGGPSADDMASWITEHGLQQVIAGRHLGKPISFAAAYELVYGERLGATARTPRGKAL